MTRISRSIATTASATPCAVARTLAAPRRTDSITHRHAQRITESCLFELLALRFNHRSVLGPGIRLLRRPVAHQRGPAALLGERRQASLADGAGGEDSGGAQRRLAPEHASRATLSPSKVCASNLSSAG